MPGTTICECCKIAPVDIIEEKEEKGYPFYLCCSCHLRLKNGALRPREFFNLATIHSCNDYMNEEIYDYCTGEALCPDMPVINAADYPFPDLNEEQNDTKKLIDLMIVVDSQQIYDKACDLLKGHDKKSILDYLMYKVAYNRSACINAYAIAGDVLGSYAANWIRQEWKTYHETDRYSFDTVLSQCLPTDEAFDLNIAIIDKMEDPYLMLSLEPFFLLRTSRTLDWMEQNYSRLMLIEEAWGHVAADSYPDWERLNKWLKFRKPLSVVALEALKRGTHPGDQYVNSSYGKDPGPVLLQMPAPDVIKNALNEYLEFDSTPRIKNLINDIINNLDNRFQ